MVIVSPVCGRGRRRRAATSASISSATRRVASGLPARRLAAAIAASRSRSPSSSRTRRARRAPSSSASATSTAAPAATIHSAFLRWWSAVAYGYGTSTAGRPQRGELGDRAAGARDHEVGGRHRLGQLRQCTGPAGSAQTACPGARARRVPRRGSAGRRRGRPAARGRRPAPPAPANASTQARFSVWAPWLPPKTSSTGRSGRRSKAASPSSRVAATCAGAQRAPGDDVLRRLESLDREAQAEPVDERAQQAVRDAQVSVGLEGQGGDAAQPRQRDHGAAGVAAAADGGGRPRLAHDAPGARRRRGEQAQRASRAAARRPGAARSRASRSCARRSRRAPGRPARVSSTKTTRAPRAATSAATASAGDRCPPVPPAASRTVAPSSADDNEAPPVGGDVEQDPDAGEDDHEAGAAETHEGQRHAGERHDAEGGADVDERLADDEARDAHGEQLAERARGTSRATLKAAQARKT